MFKKKFLVLLLLFVGLFANVIALSTVEVDAATSYYSGISTTATGSTLKSQLRTLISKQTKISTYDDCKDPAIVKKTDGNSSQSKIVLFWSGINITASWDGGTTWNREHVWPQSKGWFETSGAGADLHHIRPVDPSVNSSHNNNPYGVVTSGKYVTTSTANGSVTTQCKIGGGVYEPLDSKKGDTARIIFYLLVRYSQADSYPITNVATSMDMLLEWNRLDPVDASETRRNDAVYSIQGNRNPFIDDSYYADLIWGGATPGGNTGSGSGSSSGGSSSDSSSSGSTTTGTERTAAATLPSSNRVAAFDLGTYSSTSSDTDSSSAMSTYTETSNGYTLSLSNMSKVYTSHDASGNGCLKLGTASAVGSFSFTVPSNVDKVVMQVTGYKSNKASITVNGTGYTISTYSANTEYTDITVNTSSDKTVSITTTSSGYRCKVDAIGFYDTGSSSSGSSGSGSSSSSSVSAESALSSLQSFSTKASLIIGYDTQSFEYQMTGNYSYTFESQVWSTAHAKLLDGVKWDPETTSMTNYDTKYYGYEGARGQQFGSAEHPFSEVIIKTTDNILDGVTKVVIYASGASGTDATISAYVGTSKIGTTKTLTSSNAAYTFTSSSGLRGNVKFVIKQTTSKAIYVKGMSMTYDGGVGYYEDYVLEEAGIRFGSYLTKDLYDAIKTSTTKFGVEVATGTVSNWSTASVKTYYCTPARVASPDATTSSSTGNYYQWALLIKELGYGQIDTKISARVFVEYNGVRYYMSSTTQSIRSLANSYINNGDSEYASHTGILNHVIDY